MTPHADSALPEDPAALAAMIAALRGELAEERSARRIAELGLQAKTLEAERLRVQIARLRHERFGRSSERLAGEVEHLELRLDEVLADIAAAGGADAAEDEAASGKTPEEKARRRGRKPLPDSLPRRDVEHLPAEGCACRACGGALRKVGEDVTEILEYRPGRFEVVRHVRPAFSCRACEAMTQAPMPSLPIERGRPGPGLLAHVLVSKYCDHLPLYRQSEIYARDGLDLPRGLLAGWVGRSAELVEPMAAYIGRHALAGPRVHADDTPMPMLSPGRGRTQAARVWAYLRDDRPFGGRDPPAVFYEFTPDRKGEQPQRRLRDFQGILQADAYAGFNALYEGGRVVEAFEGTDLALPRPVIEREALAAIQEYEEALSRLEQTNDRVADAARELEGAFTSAFESAVLAAKDLQDVARALLQDLARLFLRQAFAGSGIGGVFNLLAKSIFSADGNVFDRGRVLPFARGGVLDGPIAFPLAGGLTGIAGEAGPEAIVPLARDRQGRLGIRAEGGGGVVVNQTINLTMSGGDGGASNDPAAQQRMAREIGRLARAGVLEALREQQRPGGLLRPGLAAI